MDTDQRICVYRKRVRLRNKFFPLTKTESFHSVTIGLTSTAEPAIYCALIALYSKISAHGTGFSASKTKRGGRWRTNTNYVMVHTISTLTK